MSADLALLAGGVAGVAALVLPSILASLRDSSTVAVVVAAVMLAGTDLAPFGVVLAIALVLLAWPRGIVLRLGSMLVAGALLGQALPRVADGWLGWFTLVAVLVVARVCTGSRPTYTPQGTHLLLALVSCAAYLATPDTEQVTVVALAATAAAAGDLVSKRTPPPEATAALAALTVWAIAAGSAGREAAALCVIGCLGILWVGPFGSRHKRVVDWSSPIGLALALLHIVAGVAAARIAGLGRDMGEALIRNLIITAAAVLIGRILVLRSPARPQPR